MPAQAGKAMVNADAVSWQLVGDGVERQILGYDGGLMMVRVRFAQGAVGAIHRHPHRQVTYVASGEYVVTVGDQQTTLRAGDSFFVAPDTDHGVRALTGGILVDVFTPARADFLET